MADLTFREFLTALTELVDGKKKEEKTFYTYEDIMKRYDCGETKARQIIREAQALHAYPGGKLGSGKILHTELNAWENHLPGADTYTGGTR